MDDSFLEDLELIPKESQKRTYEQVDRHVTTRYVTSSPMLRFSEQTEKDNVQLRKACSTITTATIPDLKVMGDKDLMSRDSKKRSNQNVKKYVKLKISEKGEKIEGKEKSIDSRIKADNNKQQSTNREAKRKSQETRHVKTPENRIASKDLNLHSELHKETVHSLSISAKENKHSIDTFNSHPSDISSKENSHPSDSSRENGPQDFAGEKLQINLRKSGFNVQDQDPVALLTAIKELVSMYTKQESTKILRTMQELHINSQATLIKHLLYQTDDLVGKMKPNADSARASMLIEENRRLQQESAALKMRNKDLQSKLEELKQENAALRLKYDGLTQA